MGSDLTHFQEETAIEAGQGHGAWSAWQLGLLPHVLLTQRSSSGPVEGKVSWQSLLANPKSFGLSHLALTLPSL